MTVPTTEAVIAGSRGFALSLLAPFTERIGTRPRIAAHPTQALGLCGPGALVVVEFLGEDTLRAIQDLVLQGAGPRIVAAVVDAHAAALAPLRALGVESVRWDGKPDGVLAAVLRKLAAPPPAAQAPLAGPAPAAPSARPGVVRGEGLFGGLAGPLSSAAAGDSDLAVDFHAPAAQPPASRDAPWPTSVPGPAEAADALGRGLAGAFEPPGSPFACLPQVVGNLSEIERAVFSGEPSPIDTEPLRRAAVMRVRVAAALASVPTTSADVDSGGVSALLAEIDALLSEVAALAAGAPAEFQPSLEAVRNALVKEAIDFSEAAQRSSAGEAPPAAPVKAPAARARVGRTRVLSGAKKVEVPADRRQRVLAILLGISLAAGIAFHGWRLHSRGEPPPRPTLPSAPAGTFASDPLTGGQRVLIKPKGSIRPDELQVFRERQALQGNEVREIAPGVLVVKPAAPAAGGK